MASMSCIEVTKEVWLTTMFKRMRFDPSELDYMRPQEGDVWGFVSSIAKWTADSSRKGMPLT